VGAGATDISVPPMSGYITQVDAVVPNDAGNPSKARMYFETSAFSYGPVVMPLD